jgi:putative aldouronate transport system permease protein
LLTFPAPIILAIILNEVRNQAYKKTIQTIVYLPHFLSWVIIASLTFLLLSREQGLINKIAAASGNEPTAYLFKKEWAYPIVLIQSVWKNVGWSSIVYMAAISGIDPKLYEAATIDGANKFKQMLNITLPCIMPAIAVMLVLKMGRIINVDFEQLFLLSNAMNRSVTEVFELYIYNNGIASGGTQYSYTTAIGMFKSVVSTILVLSANFIVSRKGFEGVM